MRPVGVLPATVGLAVLAFGLRARPVFLQKRVFQPGYFLPPGAGAAWAVRAVALAVAALLLVAALRVRRVAAGAARRLRGGDRAAAQGPAVEPHRAPRGAHGPGRCAARLDDPSVPHHR